MKGNQWVSPNCNSHRSGEGSNRKYYNLVRMLPYYYEHVHSLFKIRTISSSCWTIYFLNDVMHITISDYDANPDTIHRLRVNKKYYVSE
jgi:hypothetical protein